MSIGSPKSTYAPHTEMLGPWPAAAALALTRQPSVNPRNLGKSGNRAHDREHLVQENCVTQVAQRPVPAIISGLPSMGEEVGSARCLVRVRRRCPEETHLHINAIARRDDHGIKLRFGLTGTSMVK